MKGWFARMGQRFARFMSGRYGNDKLNNFLLIVALICVLLAYIPYMSFLWLVSLGLIVWTNFRCFSRNIPQRQRELFAFLGFFQKRKKKFALRRQMFRERKTHCYFKCKKCKAVLRVPKGKGMIDVTCPRCQTVTVKKT